MDVKVFRTCRPLLMLVLLAMMTWLTAAVRECNMSLMKYFGLSPNKYPLKLNMKICGNIEDNCCSLTDEVRIYNLWTEFSSDKAKRYVAGLFKDYKFILDSHEKLLQIDPSKILIERSRIEQIPYEFKICERSALLKDLMNPELSRIDLLNHNKILDIPGFDSRKLQQGVLPIGKDLNKFKSPELEDKSESKKGVKSSTQSKILISSESEASKTKKRKLNQIRKTVKTDQKAQLEQSENQDFQDGSKHRNSTKSRRKLRNKTAGVQRVFKFEEALPERKVDCVTRTHLIDKKITTVNNFKKQYCLDLRSKIKAFRIDDFYDYMANIKTDMLRLITTKKTFYCALCDMDTQQFINPALKTINFHNGFCRDLILEYRDYIKFQNVLFIEYVDMIIQYIRCFQTTAEERVFPYPNFLESFRSQFDYIQKCFDNVEGENYMDYCLFLCNKYSYTTFSNFFDGNPDFLSRVQFLIVSFFRKLQSGQEMTVDYKEIEADIEKLNVKDFNDPYYAKNATLTVHSSETRSELETNSSSANRKLFKDIYEEDPDMLAESVIHANSMIEKMKGLSSEDSGFNEIEETEISKSIYEKIEQKPLTKVFTSRFINNNAAINPIVMEEQSDFGIDPDHIISTHCKESTDKEEPALKHDVILDYFSFNSNEITNFKNDLFLPFSDYSMFQDKKLPEEVEESKFRAL